ncbi:helix-turn-helix transcriptional regulator [Serratia entomophila]|jgi:predicted ArsR family transcriptional regulator|uniref:helix-turn-helix transcriptional regulator n=1 Tax=Serratia entomophila TaxID=42906 RepID=UPI002177D5D3|nr:transcriptional regulator [Serratia entomophila]CAI1145625.1 iron-sulfur cluster biosynthesis transcriptional regulator SufR [Serratia entomophila]CAI1146941.1 iron-sulfur cluster biosynthesis transcriptional regulator SufR [Serratia entomophila]CAI1149126.1 iron-sulfur cluster biosynthesis transcriptional regulator SufR [Serratia entomophila]CAI1161167.1 iron-sulfur cluster biosynthesis transcriptional regulator SufR [Serratia entomophila]CAI1191143.1 iron-sulfur cluster biosynthesis trans
MKTPELILLQLESLGPQSAKMLADRLDITPMGIRQHLQSLEKRELVCYEESRIKVGRPTRYWSLTHQGYASIAASEHRPPTHAQLFGNEGLAPLLCARADRLYQRYADALAAEASHLDKLARLVRLRQHDGYMAELVEHPQGVLLVENHCPIGVAAASCSSLCNAELQLFHRLLGNGYQIDRTAHAISGSRHCAYLIRPREL